ncbi:MAG: DCC1-like thiol-disulfide oxidoreductase family protein [Bacteroidota bacterium]
MTLSEEIRKKLISQIPPEKGLVIFDGNCSLCNSLVGLLLKFDRNKKIHFTSVNSSVFMQAIDNLNTNEKPPPSLFYINQKGVFTQSEAFLEIALNMGVFPVIIRIISLIPVAFRDVVYRFVARNRYRWFGNTEQCIIPSQQDADRFLK